MEKRNTVAKWPRPRVVVSRCLGFEACRWNGAIIADENVERLKPYVQFETVCPEVEAGFGVPRDPIRIVVVRGETNSEIRAVQLTTGIDVTDRIVSFVEAYFARVPEPDGVILKGESPSCGLNDTKIYPSIGRVAAVSKGSGIFGGAVLDRWKSAAVESEGRLRNGRIRKHFLTVVFARAAFREARQTHSMGALVSFHARNKLLFMAYNQKRMRELGAIVANHDRAPVDEVYARYEAVMRQVLARPFRKPSLINAIQHAFGYVSQQLSASERAYFLDLLEKFRAGAVSAQAVLSVLAGYVVRFDVEYLAGQTLFEPYPPALDAPEEDPTWRPVREG